MHFWSNRGVGYLQPVGLTPVCWVKPGLLGYSPPFGCWTIPGLLGSPWPVRLTLVCWATPSLWGYYRPFGCWTIPGLLGYPQPVGLPLSCWDTPALCSILVIRPSINSTGTYFPLKNVLSHVSVHD